MVIAVFICSGPGGTKHKTRRGSPVDDRPSSDKLEHFVRKNKKKKKKKK